MATLVGSPGVGHLVQGKCEGFVVGEQGKMAALQHISEVVNRLHAGKQLARSKAEYSTWALVSFFEKIQSGCQAAICDALC